MYHKSATEKYGLPEEKRFPLLKILFRNNPQNTILVGPQTNRSEVEDLIKGSIFIHSNPILVDIDINVLQDWDKIFSTKVCCVNADADSYNWKSFFDPIKNQKNLTYWNLEGGFPTLRQAQEIIKHSDLAMFLIPFHGVKKTFLKLFPKAEIFPLGNKRNLLVYCKKDPNFKKQKIGLKRVGKWIGCPKKCRDKHGKAEVLRFRKTTKTWTCYQCKSEFSPEQYKKLKKRSHGDVV